jgi:hypothetical protein
MIQGSCLCGKVHYQISECKAEIIHCHCQTCRKAHGAAFSSVAILDEQKFNLFGTEHLNNYESSPGKHRFFCRNCGTQIYAHRKGNNKIVLRLGSLDDHPNWQAKSHIWVSHKASWYQIDQPLSQYLEYE